MTKNISPVSIPNNSKLSLAEVDDIIHNIQTPAFSIKNSITYQGLIRNAHITEGNGYLTTHGRHLKKEQLFDEAGNKVGTKLIDDLGKVYNVKHNWLLKKSHQLKNWSGGTIVAANIYNNEIYELYEDQNAYTILVTDIDQTKVLYFQQLECISAAIGSVFNKDEPLTLWMLKSSTKDETTGKYKAVIEMIDLQVGYTIKTFNVDLDSPLGEEMTATSVDDKKIVAFSNIDQERRYTLIYKTGDTFDTIYKYFGTVAPNGMITGEPIPYVENSDGTQIEMTKENDWLKRLGNGVLAWNVKAAWDSGTGKRKVGLHLGYLSNGEKLLSKTYSFDGTYTYWVCANTSIDDKAPAGIPEDDPRFKPKEWFISNFADSKDVYYAWGIGWARSYYRFCKFAEDKVVDMGIVTVGAAPGYGEDDPEKKLWRRSECLMAKGKTAEWEYKKDHLSERVYTIGGNNKGENSVLGSVPFTVDLFYKGTDAPEDTANIDTFRAQVYGLVETSYSFLQTLVTTPSEGNKDIALNISWLNNNKLTLFANGEVYEVIKSSSVEDFRLDKIADYTFRLNVLDGKNALKEDRDGNISLTRAFIPYNMECIINIEKLALTPAGLDVKDANDAWYEGVGKNVMLLVDDIAMSFLMPLIRLPLYEKEEEVDQLIKEAIDRRNSILLPALRGCFLEGEKVDTYYTLQRDNQAAEYKSTQLILEDEEAIANGWNKFGKSTYDVLKRGTSWWMEDANTVIFPLGIGSAIEGINFITPSAQLPQGYSSRLYTNNNQLFLGFNYLSQIWHGATIFTIYGQNYYYDGQGIYFLGADQDFTNNNFVTYALGMKFLANSGSEAYFFSDFEKRLYVFTGSNTLQPADLLSSVEGTIEDAVFSSKEQTLYLLTSEGRILVRTMTDLCQLTGMDSKGHLEGTTEGCAIVASEVNGEPSYKVFSPYKGEKVLPFALKTEHFGAAEVLSKCAYIDVLLYKVDENPEVTFTCQTLNGIEKESEKRTIQIHAGDWKGSQYRYRFTPQLNVGNAFDIGIFSRDEVGVQNITFYLIPQGTGQGDAWQQNVVNRAGASNNNIQAMFGNKQASISIGK